MDKSRIEETLPTLLPLTRKVGRGLARVLRVIGGFTCRWWRRVVVAVIVLIAAHSLATLITWRQLQAEINRIKARGEYVSLKQIKYPIVPDSKNGALIYEKAEALLPDRVRRPPFDKTPCELLLTCEGVVRDEFQTGEKTTADSATWSNARAELRKYASVIALVEIAQRKPKCFFGTEWAADRYCRCPKWPQLGRLPSIIAADALVKAKGGDMLGALDTVSMLFRMQDAVRDVNTLPMLHLRSWLVDTGARTLSKVVAMGDVNEDDAGRLSDQLVKIDLLAHFPDAMRAERAWMIDLFEIIRKTGNPFVDYSDGLSRGSGWPASLSPDDLYFSYVGRPLFYHDELNELRAVNYQIGLAGKPFREVSDKEKRRLEKMRSSAGWLEIFSIDFLRNRAEIDNAQAGLSGSRILLALQVYKGRLGAYPASLAELKKLDWKLDLEDPFGGRDFVYKRVGKGFVFYSIGENLKDEGGWDDYTPAQRAIHPRPDKPDDIVWRMDR